MATQFSELIKELRTKQNLLLQQLASRLDLDTFINTILKIAIIQLKQEYNPLFAQIHKADVEDLRTFC